MRWPKGHFVGLQKQEAPLTYGKDSQEGKETGRETQKEHESQESPLIHFWLGFQSSTGIKKGETILYSQKTCGLKITSLSLTHTQTEMCAVHCKEI